MSDNIFTLESTPNKFGMHENGAVTVYLASFGYPTEDINISKIKEIIWHEYMHYSMRLCLTKEEAKWAKQDWMIGKLVSVLKV